ncbi:16S rRNA (guanine(966)-N(2))-methyltransferase RsmD [Sphingomonas jatrophae]|uniref:16S rRNA (Guanine966-N2)-methyltransferase n=1 Tax=Sphingomonas jatrophae TaxID=1166337 RepID=A0A1I6L9V8_9SPHN|nr:16S rRNA (guanine(966)-N(2))-methyltransferase RsmD [Sphingomonas jatrophae]SFS00276.1 16S rRNA (guanine966-N2)-methyltransferase [Sphingomonas jatrophae]
MRIVAGRWRGRPLRAPEGAATRPTGDRVREALFSMLASRIGSFEGLRVLDLFAGTGALGLEALSRGAAACTFVEHDRAALAALNANIAALGAEGAIVRASSVAAFRAGAFDLAFLDPPYASGLGQTALAALAPPPGAWASVETGRGEDVVVPGWAVEAERVFGKAKITLLRSG